MNPTHSTAPVEYTRAQIAAAAGLQTLRQLILIETLGAASGPLPLEEARAPLASSMETLRSLITRMSPDGRDLLQVNLAHGAAGRQTTVELTPRGRKLVKLLARARPVAVAEEE